MKTLGQLLSYPRGVLISLFVVLNTAVLSTIVIFCVYVLRQKQLVEVLIRWVWCRLTLWLAGVQVDVRGDFVHRSQGDVVVFNHTSHMDILVLYGYYPRTLRFGAKIELFRIPFFGQAMRAVGGLPIDRKQRSKVMEVYKAAVPRLAAGESFALAPEGTRQDGVQLGPFKRGPFEFALAAGVNIVPVVISGATQVLPKNKLWINTGAFRRKVILEILPPVETRGFGSSQVKELQDFVHDQMASRYKELAHQG